MAGDQPVETRDCVGELVAWVEGLGDCGVEPGLTDAEVGEAEVEFRLRFPDVWKEVLRRVHPVSLPRPPRDADGVMRWWPYPDWRGRDIEGTHELINRPVTGLLAEIEANGFWWRSWGDKPNQLDERLAVASSELAKVPRLVPIRGHWYVGEDADSPVLSINQVDVWSPAVTLCDLSSGRDERDVSIGDYPLGSITFWSELHAWSQIGHLSHFGKLAELSW